MSRRMVTSASRELKILDRASRLLADATSFEDIKSIRDKAEAARTFVKAAKLGLELQNRAAELKLRAERKAGTCLAALHLRGGDRRSKQHRAALKLDDLGISRDQSRRWQRVAAVPERDFVAYLQTATAMGREVTSAGLVRIAAQAIAERNGGVRQGRTSRIEESALENNPSATEELVSELINHCQLLADVLRPMYDGANAVDFKSSERRVVRRLLDEMRDLLRELKNGSAQLGHAF